jgi:tetratricopeptide (TPR) repeat protein
MKNQVVLAIYLLLTITLLTGFTPLSSRKMAADKAYEEGYFQQAADLYRQILKEVKTDPFNHLSLIEVLHLAGQTRQANEEEKLFQELFPQKAESYFLLAQQLARKGKITEAIASHQFALTLDDKFHRCRIEYAILLLKNRQVTESFKEAGKLATATIDNVPEVLYLFALYYRLAGEYQKATPYLEAVLHFIPRDIFANCEVYRNHRMSKNKVSDQIYFRVNPDFYQRQVLAALFALLEEQDSLEIHLTELAKISSFPQVTQSIKALILQKTGQSEESQILSEQLFANYQTHNLVRLTWAICHSKKQDATWQNRLESAFQPSLDLNDPHLYLAILELFPLSISTDLRDKIVKLSTYQTDIIPPFTAAELIEYNLQ